MHLVPFPTQGAQGGVMYHVSRHRSFVGVQPSGVEVVHHMPRAPVRAQVGILHDVPPHGHIVGVPTPRCALRLYLVSLAPGRTPIRFVHELPLDIFVGIPSSRLQRVLLVPQGAWRPLRQLMLLVPQDRPVVVERELQPPSCSRRGTFVPKLLVRLLPSERLRFALMPQVP